MLSRTFLGVNVEEDEEDEEERKEIEFKDFDVYKLLDIERLTFNIALIGDSGSGKSSFVNTIRG